MAVQGEHIVRFNRPTELADWFSYALVYAPDFPAEDQTTSAIEFADARAALQQFAESCADNAGREAVMQCHRLLDVAFEYLEHDDVATACRTLQDAEEAFRQARRYIRVSDE